MDSCTAVEREVDKVLSKFNGVNEHAERTLTDITTNVEALKNELDSGQLIWLFFSHFSFVLLLV